MRSRDDPIVRRRAFIAAPLIGTIIFLAAVLFTVNLTKLEAAQSARIVNDAYHNRIVSIMEIYRTDLGSVFRESVRRNIQNFILEPGWSTFSLSNQQSGAFVSYKDLRKQRCESMKTVSIDVVCSLSRKDPRHTFGYGIPAWIQVVLGPDNQGFVFEGITFRPANLVQLKLFDPLIDGSAQSTFEQGRYQAACRKLVQANLFDCDAFANNVGTYQCKDTDGKPLPGCEQGTFYLKIDPRAEQDVYTAMPRIDGNDGFGNQVRSGAIGDDVIYLPINVRVFKYDDIALEFYKPLAYGPQERTDDRQREGIEEGLCSGTKELCREVNIRQGLGWASTGANAEATKKKLLNTFLRGAYKTGLDRAKALVGPDDRGKIELRVLTDNTVDTEKCLEHPEVCIAAQNLLVEEAKAMAIVPPTIWYSSADPSKAFAYYPEIRGLNFYVTDDRPEYKVSGTEPNHPVYGINIEAKP